jgi:hypothetical protein
METIMIIGYHFVGKTLRDGSPIPENGVWLEHKGSLKICERGLHASLHVADALKYAPGNTLCLVELAGSHKAQDDKVCYQKRRIIARFDATELLFADARASALSVIHLWKASKAVIDYLTTGDETLRKDAAAVAYDAAYDAAAAAARAAAATRAAAAYDAYYAARAAARAAADAAVAAADAAVAAAAYAAVADADADAVYDADAAARAAVYDADAVRKTNRDRLQASVDAKFKELTK